MNVITEACLEKYAKNKFTKIGCLFYKFASPNKRGVPDDLIVCPNGQVIFIEFKNPNGTGKISKLQELQIKKLRDNKATVMVIDKVELVDELIELIKEYYLA